MSTTEVPGTLSPSGENEHKAKNMKALQSRSKSQYTPASPSISFFLTGFGPFGGVPNNPTSIIIQSLRDLKAADDPKIAKINFSLLEIVRVAASSAKEQVNVIFSRVSQLQEEQQSTNQQMKATAENENYSSQNQHVVVLHFGVNHRKNKKPMFQLEQNAFNEANFRIPDEDGWTPKKEPIHPFHPKGICHRLSTDLNTKRVKDHLVEKGYKVCLSGDAGRFLCNYIYFQSLDATLKLKKGADCGSTAADGVQIHALFVHVPPFHDIPRDTQINFTIELLESITEAIIAKDKKRVRNK